MCYTIQPEGGLLGFQIPIQNQFSALANLNVDQPIAICAPSTKQVPEPTVLLGLGSGLLMLCAL